MRRHWFVSASLPVLFFAASSLCEAETIGMLENPPNGQAAAGIGVVSGWAFDDDDDDNDINIKFRIDGVTQVDVDVPCCGVRADVQAVFPEAPDETGFGFLFNFANLSAGPHMIGVDIEREDEDDRLVIDHAVTVVRPGNTDFIDAVDLSGATCSVTPEGDAIECTGVQVDSAGGPSTTDLQLQFGTSSQSFFIADATGGPELTNFVAHLNGSQEVPLVESPATGEAVLTLNADNTLSCQVTTEDIADAIAAHIHVAPPGLNGDILIPLGGGPPNWSCPADQPLTEEQLATLREGEMYVNVHSPEFPEGEIRGQIVAAPLVN